MTAIKTITFKPAARRLTIYCVGCDTPVGQTDSEATANAGDVCDECRAEGVRRPRAATDGRESFDG